VGHDVQLHDEEGGRHGGEMQLSLALGKKEAGRRVKAHREKWVGGGRLPVDGGPRGEHECACPSGGGPPRSPRRSTLCRGPSTTSTRYADHAGGIPVVQSRPSYPLHSYPLSLLASYPLACLLLPHAVCAGLPVGAGPLLGDPSYLRSLCSSLGCVRRPLRWAQAHGIRVLLCLHAAPGLADGWEHSASRDGIPQWGRPGTDYVETVGILLFLLREPRRPHHSNSTT